MTFSPFDPEVMRVTLGSRRSSVGGKSEIDRIAENAPFEEARLKGVYREIEKRLGDLLSLDFVKDDPEALDRLHQLFYAVDIEDFSKRFDHFAFHALSRLEEMGTDDDRGAEARARLRAGLGRLGGRAGTTSGPGAMQSPLSLMNQSKSLSAEAEPEASGPLAPKPRMRLRL